MTIHRCFERSFASLPAVVAFTAEAFTVERVDAALKPAVDFALEELFTNMVKYNAESEAAVRVEISGIEGGIEVALIDYDVEPFDVTQSPDVDIGLPLEQREPGGLGLHLIRRLLDSVEYAYSPEQRQSRITFRKTKGSADTGGGCSDADD